HCTAGKDRTGVGCALILKSLGVSDNEIIKDFMLSNRYRWYENNKLLVLMFLFKRNKWARYLYKRISFVHEYNIQKTLDVIKEKYPDFNDYLLNECGISKEQVAQWKEFYLE
ncbi:MAG: tyrosine-protein phosphatase, partial [Clostridia bacterium]